MSGPSIIKHCVPICNNEVSGKKSYKAMGNDLYPAVRGTDRLELFRVYIELLWTPGTISVTHPVQREVNVASRGGKRAGSN